MLGAIQIIGVVYVAFFAQAADDAPKDVEECRNVIFNCDCGNPGYKIQAVVKQCRFWTPPEQACARFYHCLECEDGLDRCVMCPPGRYGRWCNAECNCQNGGICNKKQGICKCAEGYAGENCETKTVVSRGEINCGTKGNAVIGKPGVHIQITCPSGCRRNDVVWGTTIYTADSSVCAAAIHSGFLREEGGTTTVVNNGPYSLFVGSSSNQISSNGKNGEKKSFKFSAPLVPQERTGCPEKWSESNEFCVLAAKPEIAWKMATCAS